MNPKIPYCLGIDVGVASAGWALRTLQAPYQILDFGVRIVPIDTTQANSFSKGEAVETATALRTAKRTARRNLHRYRLRRHKLSKALTALGMLPDAHLFDLSAEEKTQGLTLSTKLYGLRDRALREKLSLQEIGRILLHLNQKRGYKSSRKAQNPEETDQKNNKQGQETEGTTPQKGRTSTKTAEKGYLEKIADRESGLVASGLTIGQFFYQKFLENPLFTTKNEIYERETYQKECKAIWDFQKQFYPAVLSESNYKAICKEIIYYQRRLKSQKHLVGFCQYEPKHTRTEKGKETKTVEIGYKTAPRSSPLFQEFVVWQTVNNLRVQTRKDKKGQPLTLAQKQFLFGKLNRNEKAKLSDKECLKLLAEFDNYFADKTQGYSLNFEEVLCNATYAQLHKVLGENPDNHHYLQFELSKTDAINKETGEVYEVIAPVVEQQPLYKLWHLLYATEEDKHLKERLDDNNGFFRFEKETIAKLCKIDFTKGGFANVSAKAVRKLLPQMEKGLSVEAACQTVGYKYSDSETKEESIARELLTKLEVLPKGELRNPVVEKIINQIILLVNEIIAKHGNPAEIRIELARELRMNVKKRKKMTENIKQRTKERQKTEAELRKLIDEGKVKLKEGRDKISLGDLTKYELWKEQGGFSPYTGKAIPIGLLFDTQFYDKDHVFPKTRFYDDSTTNLVIVERADNQTKSNKHSSAALYMQSKGEVAYKEFEKFVNDCKGFSRAKKARLLATEIPDNFINRQLADTRYVGKKLREILRAVSPQVTSTTGSVTAWLREQWELDAVYLKDEKGKTKLDQRGQGIKLKEALLKEMRFEQYPHLQKEDEELQAKIEQSTGTDKDIEKYRATQRKNREDHRHHLLDAIVIAFTEQKHILHLNNLNAAYEDSTKAKEGKHYLYAEPPMPNFREVVKEALASTLVSYRGTKKVAGWKVNPKTEKREIAPRNYLHKETLYGSVMRYKTVPLDKKLLADDEQINSMVDTELQTMLQKLKKQYGQEIGALEKYLKKNPPLHQGKPVAKVTLLVREITAKYDLASISAKDIQYVVDKEVGRAIAARLKRHAEIDKEVEALDNKGKKIEDATAKTPEIEAKIKNLKDEKLLPLFLKNGMEVKTVKVFTKNDNSVTPLYDKPTTPYVQQRNNHHIALYKDQKGKIQKCVVTFWEAVIRKKVGLPVVIKDAQAAHQFIAEQKITDRFIVGKEAHLPEKDWKFVEAIVGDEMFIVDLPLADLQKTMQENNYKVLSKHLYRVQKVQSGEYVFRHHLEANLDNDEAVITLTKSSYQRAIKVKISRLGKISLAE